MVQFSEQELNRYNRQMILPGIGFVGQTKIKSARVLVVGAGGLGCPVLQYLSGAGLGTIGIIDYDRVEIHNLHRQILYSTADIGKLKSETAAEILKAQNPNVNFVVYTDMLKKSNADEIIGQYDIVIDGSDNFTTRYRINDTCVKLNKPVVYGSVLNFEGQLAVFNYKGGQNLRDVYPVPPNPEDECGCNENGVMGVVPGIIGLYMAHACLQVILETYKETALMIFDLQNFGMMKLKIG